MIGQWTKEWLEAQGFSSHFFESTTSTNFVAKERAMIEDCPTVFYLTDQQTQGRGQGSHQWLNSEPGSNLLMTCSIAIAEPPLPELCLAIGQKLKKACEDTWPNLNWSVKAPNDLLLENTKVAGILLESVSQGPNHRLLVGIGLNGLNCPREKGFPATALQDPLNAPLSQSEWMTFLKTFVPMLVKVN